MVARISQIIAAESTIRKDAEAVTTAAYHAMQQGQTFSGVIKTYEPKAEGEDAEKLPGEAQKVIRTVPEVVAAAREAWAKLFDITATKVYANTQARADVVIPGQPDQILLEDVPVEMLLFLEKRLDHILLLLSKAPVQDPGLTWTRNDNDPEGVYRSQEFITIRTKKVPTPIVLSKATEKFQAQTQLVEIDEQVGTWHRVQLTGAASRNDIETWRRRALVLQAAIKMAREQANMREAPPIQVGQTVLSYIFD